MKRLAKCMYFIRDIEPNCVIFNLDHSFPLIIVNFISLCVFRVHDYISLGLDSKRKLKRMLLPSPLPLIVEFPLKELDLMNHSGKTCF